MESGAVTLKKSGLNVTSDSFITMVSRLSITLPSTSDAFSRSPCREETGSGQTNWGVTGSEVNYLFVGATSDTGAGVILKKTSLLKCFHTDLTVFGTEVERREEEGGEL